jgi:RNA polymerase sigma-70 factor (ECF subfamily)
MSGSNDEAWQKSPGGLHGANDAPGNAGSIVDRRSISFEPTERGERVSATPTQNDSVRPCASTLQFDSKADPGDRRSLEAALVTSAATAGIAHEHISAPAGGRPRERLLEPARLGDHLDRLYRAAWALCGSREDAEDLVQETYARVLARPRLLRKEDDLGYLLRALRNTFLTQKRTESRRLRTEVLPDQLDLIADPRARLPHAEVEAGELYAAIAELPNDFRDVVMAVDVTGLSYKEAARALQIPEGTVMSRLYRARQQVVRRVEGSSA